MNQCRCFFDVVIINLSLEIFGFVFSRSSFLSCFHQRHSSNGNRSHISRESSLSMLLHRGLIETESASDANKRCTTSFFFFFLFFIFVFVFFVSVREQVDALAFSISMLFFMRSMTVIILRLFFFLSSAAKTHAFSRSFFSSSSSSFTNRTLPSCLSAHLTQRDLSFDEFFFPFFFCFQRFDGDTMKKNAMLCRCALVISSVYVHVFLNVIRPVSNNFDLFKIFIRQFNGYSNRKSICLSVSHRLSVSMYL